LGHPSSNPSRCSLIEPLEPRFLCATYGLEQLASLTNFHSYPQAAAKLYLDFDGDFTKKWGDKRPRETPAYSEDADTTTFTDEEITSILAISRRVAEKFSPFNLDVTTDDPGNLANKKTFRVVVGGDGAWFNGRRPSPAIGVSYVGGFTNGAPNTGWVFSEQTSDDLNETADTIAHEAGHGFGLNHQREKQKGRRLNEYYDGTSERAPIMGDGDHADRSLWWKTNKKSPQFSPDKIVDELAILAGKRNGFGYRVDDFGDRPATAGAISGTLAAGVIENTSDADWFSFTSAGGAVSFNARPSADAGMLDVSLAVFDASGNLLVSAATPSLDETLALDNLAAGTYYLVVSSAGSYGDVGQYSLS